MKYLICLVLMAVFGLSACGVGANNAANTSEHQASGGTTPVPIIQANNSNASPADNANSDTSDFEGTDSITDKKNPNVKESAIMSDVRSASHDGYDRVVFEFLGDELPSYHIEYIGKPVTACGSGKTIDLAGNGRLEIRFTTAQAHAPEGDATIKDRERSPNLPAVKELKLTCDFEGEVTWVAGVSSPNSYRVTELKKPTRLAVDIKNAR